MTSFRELFIKDGCDPTEEYLVTLIDEENLNGKQWERVLAKGTFDEMCQFLENYEGDHELVFWKAKDFAQQAELIPRN